MSELENQAEEQLQEEYVEESVDYEAEEVEEPSEEYLEEDSELAPDSEPEHEPNAEDDEEQVSGRVQEVINKKHRQMREAQEEVERLNKRLAELEQSQSLNQEPVIPEIPDSYDPDFDQKMKQRDQAIASYQQWHMQKQELEGRQQQRLQAQQQEQARQQAESVKSYSERARKAGIKPEALQQSASVVGQYLKGENPIHNRIAGEILKDENGPQITQYLASHPLELSDIADMDLASAVLHIERSVKPKLKGLSKTTKAPRPAKRAGGASPKPDSELLRGAKFS